MTLSKAKNFKNFISFKFCDVTARYILDLVLYFSYTYYKFICYLLLFVICLFVAAISLFTRNTSASCEISSNLVKTVLAFLIFFVYLKPVSLRVLLLGQVVSPELPETPEITEIIENFIKVTKDFTKLKDTLTNYVWEKSHFKKQ